MLDEPRIAHVANFVLQIGGLAYDITILRSLRCTPKWANDAFCAKCYKMRQMVFPAGEKYASLLR